MKVPRLRGPLLLAHDGVEGVEDHGASGGEAALDGGLLLGGGAGGVDADHAADAVGGEDHTAEGDQAQVVGGPSFPR